jgi:hypothetical protein
MEVGDPVAVFRDDGGGVGRVVPLDPGVAGVNGERDVGVGDYVAEVVDRDVLREHVLGADLDAVLAGGVVDRPHALGHQPPAIVAVGPRGRVEDGLPGVDRTRDRQARLDLLDGAPAHVLVGRSDVDAGEREVDQAVEAVVVEAFADRTRSEFRTVAAAVHDDLDEIEVEGPGSVDAVGEGNTPVRNESAVDGHGAPVSRDA